MKLIKSLFGLLAVSFSLLAALEVVLESRVHTDWSFDSFDYLVLSLASTFIVSVTSEGKNGEDD